MTLDQESEATDDAAVAGELDELASLVPEFGAVLCRIFGGGAAPASNKDAYSLIESVCVNHVADKALRARVVAALRACFQTAHGFRFLRSGLTGFLAGHLARSANSNPKNAIWCLSALEPEPMLEGLRAWTDEEVDGLCDQAIRQIAEVCARDRVLDLRRSGRGYQDGATIAKDSLLARSELQTFDRLSHDYDLVHRGLRPGLAHACELVFRLRPNRLRELVAAGDHPVVLLLIGRLTRTLRRQDHRYTLDWIDDNAPDSVIALAIHQTFETIASLGSDAHTASLPPEIYRHQVWQTELRPPADFLAVGDALLSDLVDRVSGLSDARAAKWLAELLDLAPSRDESWRPLAARCGKHLSEIIRRGGHADLVLAAIESGVATRGRRMILMAEMALGLDLGSPVRELLYARIRASIGETIAAADKRYPLNLSVPDDGAWTEALAQSLAYSAEISSPLHWVLDVARGLPLSQWDAEERPWRFGVATDAAWHLFQIGFVCLAPLNSLGRAPSPEAVREFVEWMWRYAGFVQRRSDFAHEGLIQANAVVVAVEYGTLGDEWLLGLLAQTQVHPRALRAAFQRFGKTNSRELASVILRDRYFSQIQRGLLEDWAMLTIVMASLQAPQSGFAEMAKSILDGLAIDPRHETSAPRVQLALGLAAISSELAPRAMRILASNAYHRLGQLSAEKDPALEKLILKAGWDFSR